MSRNGLRVVPVRENLRSDADQGKRGFERRFSMLVFVGVLWNYELTNCCNDIARLWAECELRREEGRHFGGHHHRYEASGER